MFGIIYDQVFEGPVSAWLGISNGLLWLALLIPPVFAGGASRRQVYWMAILSALARVLLTPDLPDLRYASSLILIMTGISFLTGMLLWQRGAAIQGLVVALALDQVLRALGSTYDISLRQDWLLVQGAWSLALILAALWMHRRMVDQQPEAEGISPSMGLALGAWLFLESSLLSFPNALARWTEGSYSLLAPALLAFSVAPGLLLHQEGKRPSIWEEGPTRWGISLVLVAGLMLGYFFRGALAILALLIAQGAALLGMEILLADRGPGIRRGGGWLSLGAFLFLLLHYFNAFAFTYPYTLPFMRQLGWQVYLAAGVAFGIGVSFAEWPDFDRGRRSGPRVQAGLIALVAIAMVAMVARARPVAPLPDDGTLRIATYNIHYGYDDHWQFTLEAQAQAIEREGVDILALQEVDAGRITSFGVDDAQYLATRLRMNAVYLPTVEHLTGIAVLHKGEPLWVEGQWLPSLQEQTGIVGVGVRWEEEELAAYGIWLGLANEDTTGQILEALSFIGATAPAAFGGDFNASEDEPLISIVAEAGFIDPFRSLGLDPPPTSPAVDPEERIDYVWIRGLLPVRAAVSDSLASDHRLVVAEIGHLP